MQETLGLAQGPVPIPSGIIQPLALAGPPVRRSGRTISLELFLALLLNLAFLLALFWRPHWMLPEQRKEPPAISVQLVPPAQAPPKPKPQEQPEPVEQEKPEEKPEEKKPEPKATYEFKGSGDVTKEKAGRVPKVDADKSKEKPQIEAKKPAPEAPKQTETEVPDWAKKLSNGYDLPAQKKSSNRQSRGSNNDDTFGMQEGEGAGDEWSNQFKTQVTAHTFIPPDLFQIIERETIVSVTVDRAGNLRGMTLVQSSGVRDFDLYVMQGLRNAAPFRPLPPGAPSAVTGYWQLGKKGSSNQR